MMPNKTTIKPKRFKDLFPHIADFEAKVIDPLKDITGTIKGGVKSYPEWLEGSFSFFNNKYIYNILKNQFSERIAYHEEEEFLGYFKNIYLQYTPMFFSRLGTVMEDTLSDLIDNDKRGIKSKLDSRSDRSDSTSPYNNTVNSKGSTDNINTSLYKMETINQNLIENAALLNSSKITGEVRKYVACFTELFTQRDLELNDIRRAGIKTLVGPKGDMSSPLVAAIMKSFITGDEGVKKLITSAVNSLKMEVDANKLEITKKASDGNVYDRGVIDAKIKDLHDTKQEKSESIKLLAKIDKNNKDLGLEVLRAENAERNAVQKSVDNTTLIGREKTRSLSAEATLRHSLENLHTAVIHGSATVSAYNDAAVRLLIHNLESSKATITELTDEITRAKLAETNNNSLITKLTNGSAVSDKLKASITYVDGENAKQDTALLAALKLKADKKAPRATKDINFHMDDGSVITLKGIV